MYHDKNFTRRVRFELMRCNEPLVYPSLSPEEDRSSLSAPDHRLADRDVREHIRGVFVPLILSKSTIKLEEWAIGSGKSVVQWKPCQANHSERHPTIEASKTAFNLVPCTNAFERDMALFLDRAPDVKAFFRNAGPEAIRIDY